MSKEFMKTENQEVQKFQTWKMNGRGCNLVSTSTYLVSFHLTGHVLFNADNAFLAFSDSCDTVFTFVINK